MIRIPFSVLGVPLAALALLLAACTSNPLVAPASTGDPVVDVQAGLSALSKFTVADILVADADAVAHNDVIAHACYPALAQFVGENSPKDGAANVAGAVSAFQVARDLKRSGTAGLPDYLKLGCAPLVMEVQNDAIKFLAQLAGLGLPVPKLPLPIPLPLG